MASAIGEEARPYRYRHFDRGVMIEAGEFQSSSPRVPEVPVVGIDGVVLTARELAAGKPLLVISASITCPMAAAAAASLQELYEEFGDRVTFLTLYTREAHPGESFPQPDTFEQKLAHARAYRERDGIPWTVAVDDLDGTFHQAMDLKPNAAYLYDGSGRLVFRVLWANDISGLRRGIGRLFGEPSSEADSSCAKILPMARGLGVLDEVLAAAGDEAKRDFLRAAPIGYAVGRSAGLFAPLPPLGRAVAATLALAALVSAEVWLVWTIAAHRVTRPLLPSQ